MGVVHGEWGTKTKPTIVPSMYEERIIGCICKYRVQFKCLCWCALIGILCNQKCLHLGDEDTTFIQWMNLKSGPPQRCECGHWYQLVKGNPTHIQH